MRKGQQAPRTVCLGLRARAWWVLRKNRSMTLTELLLALADSQHKCADGNLGHYLRELAKAGILSRERVPDGKLTSNGVYRYRLVKDLGAKAPVVRRREVFDPNSSAVYPLEVPDG
ncbi:MAG: hypothetical protein Q7U57_08100 [Methylovulum sp.]|nr:hypothetical protein [Methylovulum sp.]